MFILIIIVVLLALVFDFTNGFHDTANAIAPSVSTKALSPRFAVFYAAVLNLIGAYIFTGVAKTIGGSIADPLKIHHGVLVVLAAVLAAMMWNLITWSQGLPSSSSHALIGSLTGAVLSADGFQAINFKGFVSILQSLVISPILTLIFGYLFMTILKWIFSNTAPSKVNKGFRLLQIASAGFQAFTHGTNDAQKSMGIIAFALVAGGFQSQLTIPFWVKLLCAMAMGLGTLAGGWRIIRTVGTKIIKLEPITGFASDMTASIVNLSATLLQLPVSSTHLTSSAIMGVGASRRFSAVKWGVAGQIVIAWMITIPVSTILAALIYQVIRLIVGI